MSVHDDAPTVGAAMDSLLAQEFSDFELLVADDGSTDGSGEIMARYEADRRVRLFRRANHGIVDSVNFLIDQVRAPLIARMDGDDISLPGRLAAQVAYMDAHPEVGALGTAFQEMDGAGRHLGQPVIKPEQHERLAVLAEHAQPICNPSAMIRTGLIRVLGGYRRAYRAAEDYDLFLRLSRVARLANLSEVLLLYRRSGEQVTARLNDEMGLNAVIAWAAHREVLCGRPDPTESLDRLPGVRDLEQLFAPELARVMRGRVAVTRRYRRDAMAGAQFDWLLDHVREGGAVPDGWRTIARLVSFGLPERAARLAAAMLFAQAPQRTPAASLASSLPPPA